MTTFVRKDWQDAPPGWAIGDPLPPGATPLDDASLTDLETRINNAIVDLDARITALSATTVFMTDPGEPPPSPTAAAEDDLWIEVLT